MDFLPTTVPAGGAAVAAAAASSATGIATTLTIIRLLSRRIVTGPLIADSPEEMLLLDAAAESVWRTGQRVFVEESQY